MSPKKTNENKSTWGTIVVKSNFFIPYFGELKIPKRHFEINWPLADQIMDLRTQSVIMGNLRAKGLAIMSLYVTPSVKLKKRAKPKCSVVLAYNGGKKVKVLDFRHPRGSWFPTDVATTLLQRHEISHKCKVAPFCTTQKRSLLHWTIIHFHHISSGENILTRAAETYKDMFSGL